jgi:hypothetical protein
VSGAHFISLKKMIGSMAETFVDVSTSCCVPSETLASKELLAVRFAPHGRRARRRAPCRTQGGAPTGRVRRSPRQTASVMARGGVVIWKLSQRAGRVAFAQICSARAAAVLAPASFGGHQTPGEIGADDVNIAGARVVVIPRDLADAAAEDVVVRVPNSGPGGSPAIQSRIS